MSERLLEFKEVIRSRAPDRKVDSQTRSLLLYLFTSTKGGLTRLRIIMYLLERPYSIPQLAKEMGLDYKAIQHHLRVLDKNSMVSKTGKRYGAEFCLSNLLEANLSALDEVIEKLDAKLSRKKVYL